MRHYEHGGDTYGSQANLLDFSVNVNPLGMPEAAKQAISDNMDSFITYPDCECRVLRAALSEKHGIGVEHILCGNGASDLIFRVCALLGKRAALTLAPTFSEYERTVMLFGGRMLEHPLQVENGSALTADILPLLTEKVDMLFLCNPNNPTGRLADPSLLAAILERCYRNDILLILDECFLGFTDGESFLPALSQYPNLLILKAFTKFYGMAGLRLGYLLGDPALLARIRQFGPEWSVSSVAQAAGLGALSEPDWAARTRALVDTERGYLTGELQKCGLTVFPSDSNFLLVKGQRPLHEALRQKGILVRACDNFSGLDAQYVRIGLKTHERNAVLVNAVREVLA